ncbi:hypothetical protein HG535_0F03700 [Zygotorulaspora mrakii]|uniref:Purine-cytosine permease n=1 Tax=Zygotorulaspora mrakii TaxID=42260 RepID=A0A7H9B7C0_ZYGMR|nr:uncharacterized protein HG535_0F03700 [Zygotorulaspora mrakii]QLG73859.1 hypothetical protein HG535_0F03700 [Zygotorulaspora mrakii]
MSGKEAYEIHDLEGNVDRSQSSSEHVGSTNSEKKNPYVDVEDQEYEDEQYASGVAEKSRLGWCRRAVATLLDKAETKGVEPVTDEEKTDISPWGPASMWFSANMVIAAYSLGALGPLVFSLNFGTSVLTIVFFNLLGLVSVAFFSIFGAEFGLRQMVLSRFLLGNLTARAFAFINVIACVGWGVVNTIVSAQLLHMINSGGNQCPPWAGCLIIIGATVLITFFGIRIIHAYERWSWVPNFAVFLVIIARLAKNGSFQNGEWTSGPSTAGGVLSFGSAIFGFASGWTTYASDYTVYMKKEANKYKIFFTFVLCLAFPLFFCMILGAASAMGTFNNTTYADYYNNYSIGGLTYAILVPDSLHGFGQFCCVLLALSTVANNIPNMYSVALSAQATWEPLAKIPRVVWTLAANGATLGISIAAYYKFENFMENFMNSIGYYLAIYISIALSEHFIYRKGFKGYDIDQWNRWDLLPIGIAGCSALFVAGFGVALGMSQTYWTGEIGRLIGDFGGDIGFELGAGFAFIVYNVLRPLEIKYMGR